MISPEDLQQLLQASAATQQPNMDWNANAELIHQLQQMQQVMTSSIDPLVSTYSCLLGCQHDAMLKEEFVASVGITCDLSDSPCGQV